MTRREDPEKLSASGSPLRASEAGDRSRARPATMPSPVTRAGIATLAASYLYDSWIRTAGAGWTRPQVCIGYVSSLAFPLMLLAYAAHADLRWSIAQTVAASLIAWDLCTGALGYNHPAMKERGRRDPGSVRVLHHNLQHIHPLVLIFFEEPTWLPAPDGCPAVDLIGLVTRSLRESVGVAAVELAGICWHERRWAGPACFR